MKTIGIFLLSFIVSVPVFPQFFSESLNTKELIKVNRVKTEAVYHSVNPSGNSLFYIRNYDTNGNVISNKTFLFRGQPFLRDTLIYDNNLKCTKKIQFDKNGIPENDYVYSYDEKGNLTLTEIFRKDTLIYSQKKCYDETNQNTKDSSKYYSSGFFESGLFFYDEDGLRTKTIIKLTPDSSFTTIYKYNKKKILVGKHLTKIDSEIFYKYSYNSNDQCSKEKRTSVKGGKKNKTVIKYSRLANGLLSKKEECIDDKSPRILTFQYIYY